MPRLLSVNSYHYRRGGADGVYFDHAALMEASGWQNAYFAMHHPRNEASDYSRFFVDEIQFGHDYSLPDKLVKATKVVYSLEAQRKLRALIAEYRPDVAHLHNIYHHLSPSILPVLRKAGIPVVMTAHDLKIACPNNKMFARDGICERCKGHRYRNVVLQRCVQDSTAASAIVAAEATLHRALGSYRRFVDRIIVPSQFYIEKFVQWGWPRETFSHVPNYVDAAAYEASDHCGDHFLYFGRIATEKGIATLIRAVARSGAALRIAGTGPVEADMKALAQSLQADVEFLGFRRGEELKREIRECRAVVLPSEWYENAPLSILECFAMGKAAIGADIGGIPELIRPGHTGWLFPSGNVEALAEALDKVLNAPVSEVMTLGRTARALVQEKFTKQLYLDEIKSIYQGLGVQA